MNLGIFLYRGGSLEELRKFGQETRHINYYFKRYSKNFDNVFIFSYKNEGRDLPENCRLIPNKYRIPLFLYQFLMPIINRKYVKQCDVFRVFHTSGTIPAIICRVFFGKRYVTTYGYLWLKDMKLRKKGLIQRMIAKLIEFFGFKFADRVIVTINETRDYVKKTIPENRIVKIENSVDIKLFKPMENKEGGIKKLLYLGRLEESQKNLKSLIKAVSLLKGNPELIFVGGRDKKRIVGYESYARELGVNLNVSGPVPHEQVPRVYKNADVFCLVSHWEGMPKVLLEAMACGLPCLSTATEETKEIVSNKTAILCGTDPESIAEKLSWIIRNPERVRKIGSNAREFIKNNFSADVLIGKEIKLLKRIGKR